MNDGDLELRADWEIDDESYFYDSYDYQGECERLYCNNAIYGEQKVCNECAIEDGKMELLEYSETRGQRRESKRSRGRYGMVKHLPGDFRPMKMPKGKVR